MIENQNERPNMLNFALFDKTSKIACVKSLCANDKRPWKSIPPSHFLMLEATFFYGVNVTVQYQNLPKILLMMQCPIDRKLKRW